jgi:LacI family transcriptional regulator
VAGASRGQRRRILLEDVAQGAGVSRSTASRALSDDPRISLATRTAVKRVASDLRYIPNVSARSLRVQRTRTFGLLLPELSDPVHGQIASAFEQAAGDEGFEVMFVSGYENRDRERLAMKTFAERGMDAVAIVSCTVRLAEVGEFLDPARVVVALSEDVGVGDPERAGAIHIDEAGGVNRAVDHLVARGYRRIAYVGSGARRANIVRERACGDAVRRHGLVALRAFRGADDAWRAPDELARAIAAHPPDALVCFDDKLALALMDALRRHGVRCPDDVGIVGFDGIPFAAMSNPRLTTVAAPSAQLGKLAASTLLTAMNSGTLPPAVVLPVELVDGESTPMRGAEHTKACRA